MPRLKKIANDERNSEGVNCIYSAGFCYVLQLAFG
jgi:hypothetical protein